jgi:hypothetical protein
MLEATAGWGQVEGPTLPDSKPLMSSSQPAGHWWQAG